MMLPRQPPPLSCVPAAYSGRGPGTSLSPRSPIPEPDSIRQAGPAEWPSLTSPLSPTWPRPLRSPRWQFSNSGSACPSEPWASPGSAQNREEHQRLRDSQRGRPKGRLRAKPRDWRSGRAPKPRDKSLQAVVPGWCLGLLPTDDRPPALPGTESPSESAHSFPTFTLT